MPLKASVCIDAVLAKTPIETALQIVAKAGYRAFEFWMWWEKDLDEIINFRDRYGLQIAACCTKFVSLVDPATRQDYLDGLSESLAAARKLQCPVLISQVGDFRLGVARQEQHDCLVEGLREAAKMLDGSGVVLAIEPLNELVDHAGYYLIRSQEAFEIIDKVSSPHVKVTYDIYHQQISEGHLIANIRANIDKIAHFHAAGNPGRHELNRGEIHYPAIFDSIRQTDYEGYVGLEYWPVEDREQGLAEVARWFAP